MKHVHHEKSRFQAGMLPKCAEMALIVLVAILTLLPMLMLMLVPIQM